MDVCDLYQRQTSLAEDFDSIRVHHYMFIAHNYIHDATIYSIHTLNNAQKFLADSQCKLIANPRWQKIMDISLGDELKYPLSITFEKK